MRIGEHIEHHARLFPEKASLVCGEDRLDWQTLAVLANRVSNWIASTTPTQARIALVLPNCLALPVLVLAIARAGRIAQVLDPAWPDVVLSATVKRCEPALCIGAGADRAAPINSITLGERPAASELAKLVCDSAETFAIQASPTDAFYTGFTSGSTGMPKGFTRNHVSWTQSFEAERIEFSIGSSDVFLAPGSLTHSLFLYAALRSIHAGATAVLMPSFRPAAVSQLACNKGATILYAVPAQLKLIAAACANQDRMEVPSLRHLVSSGSKWSEGDRDFFRSLFPSAEFSEFYGASELSFVSVAKENERPPAGSVGRAFHGVDIKIFGDEGLPMEPPGTGQIYVRSDMVSDGYAGQTGASAVERIGDYLSVGDIGYLDANGFLYLTGRKDRMIVTAGKNLFPEEIEAVLEAHPGVNAAAVIGIKDAVRGTRIVGLLQRSDVCAVSRADLVRHARANLPLYKIPRQYYSIADWPRTRSGKSDFAALTRLLVVSDACLEEIS